MWVDPETRSLTQAAVAFSDMGEHGLKGKAEPVRLFRADTVVAAVGGAQRVDGLQAPMTGRDGELRTVKEALHATQADGRARLVVVTGVAGVGKSRLGWEFEKYVDGLRGRVAWHRGRSLSYGEGAAFWAFAEMVRSRLRILETDDRVTVADKTAAGVRAAAVVGAGGGLVVAAGGGAGQRERDGVVRADGSVRGVDDVPGAGRGADPVVLVFEDAQYADSGLVDLVEHLMQSIRCKLFVLVLTRTELLERWPALAEGRGRTRVDLAPLLEEAMTALVDGLVSDLPVRARAALVARAEGVPLYAVETVRSLIDQDAVLARDGRYVFVDHDYAIVDLGRLTAPTSLQTLIAARLDALTATERRTVQDASVLGMTFRYASLLALSGTSSHALDGALAGLVGKGVLETQDDPRSPELGQYRFLQAMVREVAYSTLARSDRRARHLAAAEQLTREEEEGTEALAGIIAQHLLDALAASTGHDPERAALSVRARSLLTIAATRAEGLGAPEEALANTLAALALDPRDEERCNLQLRAARTAGLAGQFTLSEELAASAAEGYETSGDDLGVVASLAQRMWACQQLGRLREAEELAQQAQRLIAGRDDVPPDVRTSVLGMLAWTARTRGDRAAQQTHSFAALHIAERLQDPALIVRGLGRLSSLMVDLGSAAASRALTERAVVLAREQHMLSGLANSLNNLMSDAYGVDLISSGALVRESVAVCKQVGDSVTTETALINASYAWFLAGEWDLLTHEVAEWLEGRELTAGCGSLWMSWAQVQLARGEPVVVPEPPYAEDPYDQQAWSVASALAQAADGDLASAALTAAEASRRSFGDGKLFEDFEVLWAPTVELQLNAGAAGRRRGSPGARGALRHRREVARADRAVCPQGCAACWPWPAGRTRSPTCARPRSRWRRTARRTCWRGPDSSWGGG